MTGTTQTTSSTAMRAFSAVLLLSAAWGCTGQLTRQSAGSGAGGGADGIAISSPADGALVARARVEVQGAADLPDGTTVDVNGVAATVMEGRFTATVELAEGPARIEALVEGGRSDAVEVTVDTTPPRIVLAPVEERAFQEGTTFTIGGYVEDSSAVSLTVDDEAIVVASDGTFLFERPVDPGAHRIRLTAQDEAGHLGHAHAAAVVGEFRAPEETLDNAMALELGADALTEISRGIAGHLSRIDVERILRARNPVVSEWWGHVDVTGESHGRITVSLETGSDHLHPSVTVHDVRVDFDVHGRWGGTASGYLYADRAVLTSTARLAALDGRPEVTLSGASARLERFRFEMAWVPSWVESWDAVRGRTRRRTENAIRDAVSRALPPYIEGALSRLPRGGGVEVGGRSLYVGVELADLGVDRNGIWAAVDVTPSSRSDGPVPGSLWLGADRPPYENGPSVDVAVSLDSVNAALHEAWLRGLLDRTVGGPRVGDEPLTVGYLTLLLPALRGLAPAGAAVDFHVVPALPPVLVETVERPTMIAADVHVEVVAQVPGEDAIPLFTLSLGAHASTYPRVRDGELAVGVGAVELAADLVDGPEGLPVGPELEELLLTVVGDRLEESMEIGGFRVPSLRGFRLSASRAEVRQGYISLGGRLRYQP